MSSLLLALLLSGCITRMPGQSFRGPLPPLTPAQTQAANRLRQDVTYLASTIGCRNVEHREGLAAAEFFLTNELQKSGHNIQRQTYPVKGFDCSNLIAEIRGTTMPDQIVVVGAHYDSVHDCPAANDNGSGTAATLELARMWAKRDKPARTLRFVLFVNEEPPRFWTSQMGSLVYARACRAKNESIVAMLSLETMGYYSDEPGSQDYPPPFSLLYPREGNFIGFVGNYGSRELVRRCVGAFRDKAAFPSEGAAVTMLVPRIGSSDHWSFWQAGYPALMVTDTAPYRYPHYHKLTDTPDKIDYEKLARVVEGVAAVVDDLTSR